MVSTSHIKCPYDTDHDGNCHLCHGDHKGCFYRSNQSAWATQVPGNSVHIGMDLGSLDGDQHAFQLLDVDGNPASIDQVRQLLTRLGHSYEHLSDAEVAKIVMALDFSGIHPLASVGVDNGSPDGDRAVVTKSWLREVAELIIAIIVLVFSLITLYRIIHALF